MSVSPATVTVIAGSSSTFQLSVQALNGFTGSVSVQVTGLPAGVTLNPSSPISVIATTPQTVTLNVALSTAPGTYPIQIAATSSSISHSGSLSITVQAPPTPDFSLTLTPATLTLVPGTQNTFQVGVQAVAGFTGLVQVQVSGLPADVTVSPVWPFSVSSSQSQTVTVGAASSLQGSYTLTINGASGSLNHTVKENLTLQNSAALPSRADFVRTDDTPGEAVYDKLHQRVYETNPVAGTVDVISSVTYQILRRIPVPSPEGIDISPDDSTVFIGTGTQALFALDTVSMAITARYLAPLNQANPITAAQPPEAPVAAPDGTVLLSIGGQIVKWNPVTNQTSTVTASAPMNFQYGRAEGPMARSASHTKVILSNNTSQSTVDVFDTTTNTFSAPLTFYGFASAVAVNPAGTQFAVAWTDNNSVPWITFLDANLNTLATVSGGGNILYSLDGKTLYESGIWNGQLPAIGLMSATTYSLTALKPLYASSVGNRGPATMASTPLAADETGRVFGSADHGLAIDDVTDQRTYTGSEAYPSNDLFAVPDNGPVGQKVPIQIETSNSAVSNIWFGPLAGAYIGDQPYLSVETAALNQTGPINLRMEDTDHVEAWMPQAYTYGSILSPGPDIAASASGGTSIQLFGFGLGNNATALGTNFGAETTISFAGTDGTVLSAYSGPPETGSTASYPFPLWDLTVKTPALNAGAGDIVATTPSGTSTLHSAYHALNMPSYALDGVPASTAFDTNRQQLYIAVADHIDVFSLASQKFLTPIQVPTLNQIKQLGGITLTPDGKSLIVANWGDASVVVIDPDNPSTAKTVAVGTLPSQSVFGQGPNQLAATNTGLVFIGVGGPTDSILTAVGEKVVPALRSSAPAGGIRPMDSNSDEPSVWVLNLGSMTVAPFNAMLNTHSAPYMSASRDGSQVCFTGQYFGLVLYRSADASLATGPWTGHFCAVKQSVAVTDDLGVGANFVNLNLLKTGNTNSLDFQAGVVGSNISPIGLDVDDQGALVYLAFNNYVEIFDAHTGELRELVSLPGPMYDLLFDSGSIVTDDTGARIFLFTANGLATIQLDTPPLAIGSVTASGNAWTIAGTGFVAGTSVSADGNPLATQYIDSNHLNVSAASSLSGIHTVTLTNPDGHAYTYDAAYLR